MKEREGAISIFAVLLFVSTAAWGNDESEKSEQLISLWSQARIFLSEEKISHAQTVAEALLFLDPSNLQARDLWNRTAASLNFPPKEIRRVPRRSGIQPVPERAMELQILRFNAVSTGRLLPATNPQLGLE